MLSLLPGLLLSFAPPVLPESPNGATSPPTADATAAPEAPPDDESAAAEPPADPTPEAGETPETSAPLPMQPAEAPVEVEPPQPEPTVQPQPEVLPPAAVEVGPVEAAGPEPGFVRVQRPRYAGTGMFIASGVTFGAAALVQAIDSLVAGDQGTGILERMFLATSMGMAAGGGIKKGHADAYDDTVFRRKRPETRKLLIAGAVLVGAGATLGLVNEGMWWHCVFNDSGPYSIELDEDTFQLYGCRYGLTRGLLDLSSGATAAGLGMLTWALVYRRDARAYEGARVVAMQPTFGRGQAGLSITGRF
ncbi:MAG: hypothetical protein AAF721_09575 [Myxococcota bacterium]